MLILEIEDNRKIPAYVHKNVYMHTLLHLDLWRLAGWWFQLGFKLGGRFARAAGNRSERRRCRQPAEWAGGLHQQHVPSKCTTAVDTVRTIMCKAQGGTGAFTCVANLSTQAVYLDKYCPAKARSVPW